jgi:hypothetical protein
MYTPGMQPGMQSAPASPFKPAKRRNPFVRIVIALVIVGVIGGALAIVGALKTDIYSNALTGTLSDWPSDSNCSGQADGYHIKGSADGSLLCAPDLADQSDVTVTVTLKQLSGAQDLYAGIALRRPSQGNAYVFGISGDGAWTFAKFAGGQFSSINGDNTSTTIHTGLNATNTLQVTAKGTHFTFTINGTKVGQVDDATYPSGKVGLTVGGDIEVVFTDIKIVKA